MRIFFILTTLFVLCPGLVLAQTDFDLSELNKLSGETAGDGVGYSVVMGDVNNDGYDDFLIGAMEYSSYTGLVYLIYGGAEEISSMRLSSADAIFVGEGTSDRAGFSVAFGNINGDDYEDILIGARAEDTGGLYGGAAYIIYGQSTEFSGTTNLSSADAKFTGISGSTGDGAGYDLASGDLDNDGYDDFLISTPGDDTIGYNAGALHIIYGQSAEYSGSLPLATNADAEFQAEALNNAASWSVYSGDINNDNYDDIVLTAPGDAEGGFQAGAVYIIYGQSTDFSGVASLSTADAKFTGEGENYSVKEVSLGDVNGDNYQDIIVGNNGNDEAGSNAGAVYIIYGQSTDFAGTASLSTADAKFTGEAAEDEAGYSVNSGGDVNNDGYDDILIGAHLNDDGGVSSGISYLIYGQSTEYSGSASLSIADLKFIGEGAGDQAGFSVCLAGDLNNDGYSELLIGAKEENAVYLGYLYIDADGDGVAGDTGLFAGTDCNDNDGTVSENQTYYADNDEDGYGDPNSTTSICSSTAPDGYVTNADDDNDNYNSANVPSVPENPLLQDRGIYKATVEWDEVSGVSHYDVRYRKSSEDDYTSVISSTNSKELTDLQNAGKYYWQVRAVVSDVYYSDWTDEKRLVTYPRKITKSEFTFPKNKREANQVRIKIETMAKRVTGFNILVYKKKGGKWTKIETVKRANDSSKNHVYKYITGLKPDTKYKFEVKARRTIGSTKYLSQNVAKRYITTSSL